MAEASIDYSVLEQERSGSLQSHFEMKLAKRVTDDLSGLRRIVLQSVVAGQYEGAKEEVITYVNSKEDYPSFRPRISRYVSHSQDLIAAIESKRNFPGLSSLPVSKQQDIFEKVIDHFDELRQVLTRIEATSHEVRLNDIRSTVIFIKSVAWSMIGIVFLALILDLTNGLLSSADDMVNLVSTSLVESIFDFLEF